MFTILKIHVLSAGNHSITQSSFSDPCSLMTDGFDSGWVLVTASEAETPQFNLTITDDSHRSLFFELCLMSCHILTCIYSHLVLLQAT